MLKKYDSLTAGDRIADLRIGAVGAGSGGMAVLGSYNVCHALCMGAVSLLSLAGITLRNLPFLFLQDYAPYFWGLTIVALAVSMGLYIRYRHGPMKKWVWANAGFALAGVPFSSPASLLLILQGTGIAFLLYAVWMWKNEKKTC